MIRTIKYTLQALLLAAVLTSCTDHRNLYIAAAPMLLVENDWDPSRTNQPRPQDNVPEGYSDPKATLVVYPLQSPIFCLENHKRKVVTLDQGEYHMLVFNDYMYSETQTFLRNIRYRNTDNFDNFEAYVTEAGSRFKARADEVIVNNPDTLSTRSTVDFSIEGKRTFHMKYKDGKGGKPNKGDKNNTPEFPMAQNYIEDTLQFTPCRVVHTCVVSVHTINVKALNGVGKARASLRGFSGSVFMANRLPGPSNITHQFNLNGLVLDPGSAVDGTIAARFSTFGPPFDDPDRAYELEIYVLYPSGREAPPFLIDVTEQVRPQIERMKAERLDDKPIMEDILIQVEITLESDRGDWDVSLDDWGDDIIITVPVGL